MKLRILTIEASKIKDIFPKEIPFRNFAHHIKEQFLFFLPKNVEINKSSKIEIVFGPKGNEPLFDNVLGSTNYFIEEFDFKAFYELSDIEKEYIVLEKIKETLIKLSDKKVEIEILETTKKLYENKFNLEIEIKKLSKYLTNKKRKISIFRILNKDIGEGWKYKIIDTNTKEIIEENWMTKIPNYLDKTDYFKKSIINEDKFIIVNNLEKVVFEI